MSILTRLANGKTILLLLVLFLLTNVVIVPLVYPKFQTLDTLYTYTPGEAYNLISSYGDAGRVAYIWTECTLDVIYPFISALLFGLAILYTFQRAFPTLAWSHKLALTPFLVMLSDYFENMCVVILLLNFPRRLDGIAQMSDFFTRAKFFLTPLELLFLAGLASWAMRAILNRKPVRENASH